MNLTLVKERKYTLTAMKEQKLLAMKVLLAEIKQIDGRLSECDYWLTVADKEDTMNSIASLRLAIENETK